MKSLFKICSENYFRKNQNSSQFQQNTIVEFKQIRRRRQRERHKTINNYWMRLSMIARIIKAEVCVICRSRRLRRITQTEALIILAIM